MIIVNHILQKLSGIRPISLTKRQKIIVLSSAAGGLVLLLGAAILLACIRTDVPPAATVQNAPAVAKFIASPQFAKLDSDAKTEYVRQINEDSQIRLAIAEQRENLSDDERSNMRQNMRTIRQQQMQERMDKYFSMKTPEEKNKILDEILADMQKHSQARPQQPNATPANNNRPQANDNASRQQRRMRFRETASPQQHAQRRQFHADLIARAKALGVPLPWRRHR
ncbi:MAG TPA: hypothetical protein PKK48_07575 [Phycisphaerae bacterium]|nr:hypothetical protein [Phycisphaerae bacterium]HPS53349.1 hypothetical protein [Phycisphaerae bacterium]